MKIATANDLQYRFGKLSKWLVAGETIQILRDGQPWARVIPSPEIMKPIKERESLRRKN